MAPEQTGRLGVIADYRADLYSLGVVLFQLATGRLPFEQCATPAEIIHATIAESQTPSVRVNERIPLVLSNLIDKLLAKSPDQRYQSAYGVWCDLKVFFFSSSFLSLMQSTQRILTSVSQYILARVDRSIVSPENNDHHFVLGQHDKPLLYRLPATTYGREQDCAELLSIYERVHTGALGRVLVLLGGPAGVGKSALVGVLHQHVAIDCMYASGKVRLISLTIGALTVT